MELVLEVMIASLHSAGAAAAYAAACAAMWPDKSVLVLTHLYAATNCIDILLAFGFIAASAAAALCAVGVAGHCSQHSAHPQPEYAPL